MILCSHRTIFTKFLGAGGCRGVFYRRGAPGLVFGVERTLWFMSAYFYMSSNSGAGLLPELPN